MKKFASLLAGLFVGLFAVGLVIAFRMGVFNSVRLVREERGPYRVVCLPHAGAHNRIGEKILKVEKRLKEAGVERVVPCGIYYGDPLKVAKADLRSKGGFVIEGEFASEPPFEVEQVPLREVLVARFKGVPTLAAVKVGPAVAGWLAENGFRRAGPAVEFYRRGLVEREVPIVKVDAEGRTPNIER